MIACSDVTAAFFQGENLTRDIFVHYPPEAKEEEKIWRLMKPVCGLDDACRNFYCIVLVLQLAVVFIL